MIESKALVVALATATFLTAGAAYAADEAAQPKPQQSTLAKDATKLSADGSRAYNNLALTRLAIFDGRVADAKKFVDQADADFMKAKNDNTAFMKAEADLKAPDATTGSEMAKGTDKEGDASGSHAATQENDAKTADATTPKAWLPIDADMSVDENFTANPTKSAAVADANKSLAKGDTKGAMEKLKLADVSMTYVMAVVPLDQTLADVHQAAQDIDGGKYYEGSQVLRQVQDSTRYDVIEASGVPGKPAAKDAKAPAEPATH